MASKFYSVYKGKSGVPMILRSWEECKNEVIGFKGAIYKSFKTLDEAKEFLVLSSNGKKINDNIKDTKKVKNESFIDENGLTIYVDGSFSLEKENFSYGLVALDKGEIIFKDNGVGFDEKAIALRNVSGEVLGSMKAIEFAIEKGYSEVSIVFDYQGIESWALGTWKRNNDITKGYHEFIKEKSKLIKINFIKVKGHSGDKYNDIADELAKSALGIL
ncbi:ribonuclease H family protein [Clostridium sp. LY3-2]|uniref:ribonuclease H family protein n=1 Tax=Clostridium sp. LY3-2 TaxID=2942482 RepID=UPI002153302A|nr:ribonuclease H family protein [Clostridium sp. LY3-2]MCR6515706.1 ribonuclease H family protein [Clostridium sp. LY3-2]